MIYGHPIKIILLFLSGNVSEKVRKLMQKKNERLAQFLQISVFYQI